MTTHLKFVKMTVSSLCPVASLVPQIKLLECRDDEVGLVEKHVEATSSAPSTAPSTPELERSASYDGSAPSTPEHQRSSFSDEGSPSECDDGASSAGDLEYLSVLLGDGHKQLHAMSRRPSHEASPESLHPAKELLESPAFFETKAIDEAPAHKSETQQAPTVLVVGAGYVGEQLVRSFSAHYRVFALEISEARRATLRAQFAAHSSVHVIGNLGDSLAAQAFDLALVSVPTVLRPDCQSVDSAHIEAAAASLLPYARPGATVVVESSVTVGMTRELFGAFRARGVFVGFSPERVDPGRQQPAFTQIAKIVSGIDAASLAQVQRFYAPVFDSVVSVTSLETAEFAKLFENCQRLMLVAYVNEMADVCAAKGIDIHEVCAASATKPFGYTAFSPSLGAGGHCIPVNPWYLLSNCEAPLLREAARRNQARPAEKALEIAAAAKRIAERRSVAQARVLMLGLAFKPGQASLAYAPAVTVAKQLAEDGLAVSYLDEAVASAPWPRLDAADLARRSSPAEYDVDRLFEVIVVAHRPTPPQLEVLQALRSAEVIYFAR